MHNNRLHCGILPVCFVSFLTMNNSRLKYFCHVMVQWKRHCIAWCFLSEHPLLVTACDESKYTFFIILSVNQCGFHSQLVVVVDPEREEEGCEEEGERTHIHSLDILILVCLIGSKHSKTKCKKDNSLLPIRQSLMYWIAQEWQKSIINIMSFKAYAMRNKSNQIKK